MDEESQRQPLLRGSTTSTNESSLIQKVISQTFRSTSNLANLLPTGTVLIFQLLSPIFSDEGKCDYVTKGMTAALVSFCGLLCFLSCFTDTYKDDKGVVHYGIVTFEGLWIIDGSVTIPTAQAAAYRLKFIDFLHAFMSTVVFAAIALFDQDVVNCFYPTPSKETLEILTALPVGVGVIGSAFFVKFPTTRHGIGYPLSSS